MTDISSQRDRGRSDLLDAAEALEQVRKQAKELIDRGLGWPRTAVGATPSSDDSSGSDVGRVNLAPFRSRDAISLDDGGSLSARDGDTAFRKAASEYVNDLYHPAPITGDRVRQIMPGAGAKADEYAPYLESAMTLGGILTPSQRAAFLGQVAAETGDLRPRRESLNYSDAQRAANIFDRTFHGDPEQAQPYLGNSEKMANHVYERLNGNGLEASGDGYTYRGGGFLQITGRNGYREVGLENHPEEIERPDVAARASVDHWLAHHFNDGTFEPITSQDAFDEVTRKINSGLLQGRQRWEAYGRGLRALSKPVSRQP